MKLTIHSVCCAFTTDTSTEIFIRYLWEVPVDSNFSHHQSFSLQIFDQTRSNLYISYYLINPLSFAREHFLIFCQWLTNLFLHIAFVLGTVRETNYMYYCSHFMHMLNSKHTSFTFMQNIKVWSVPQDFAPCCISLSLRFPVYQATSCFLI